MAKGATVTPEVPATEAPAKGQARPRAAVTTINWADASSKEALKSVTAERKSQWTALLDDLYEGTEKGLAPRVDGADSELQFVKLGTFNNVGGARTQIKALEDKGFDKVYDFKPTTAGKQSFLWARVKEV